MGRTPQTWKPWPLGPSPLTLGLELEPAGRGADARQRQRRATARASDATIVPSLEASTSALSRNFSIGIDHLAAFSLSILSSSLTTRQAYPANLASIDLSSRNRCPSLPQTVKHLPREDHARTDATNSRTHNRHPLQRNHTLVPKRRFSAEHKRTWVRECHGFPASCGQRRKLGY